jgi:hypothetical protein
VEDLVKTVFLNFSPPDDVEEVFFSLAERTQRHLKLTHQSVKNAHVKEKNDSLVGSASLYFERVYLVWSDEDHISFSDLIGFALYNVGYLPF